MKFSTSALALAVAGLCVSAQAGADIGFDFNSAYVPSGATCNDGWVFQPYMDAWDVKVGYNFKSGETALFNASLRLKYRFGGNSEGKYELIADIHRGFDLSECLSLTAGADLVYVNVDDADNNKGEDKLDSGLACADIYAKLSCGEFTVGCTYVAQIDDDVLPDGVYGYDVEWIANIGWYHEF